MVETKRCSRCGLTLSLACFGSQPSSQDGRHSWCKKCLNAYRKQWYRADLAARRLANRTASLTPEQRTRRLEIQRRYRERHPDKAWTDNLKKHGLSAERWLALMERQGGCCAICRTPIARGRGTHIDHDHRCCPGPTSCGECVRGLLCHNCNRGLGYLGDSDQRLEAALRYVRMT